MPLQTVKKINFQKKILCYIDLLGYSNFITKYAQDKRYPQYFYAYLKILNQIRQRINIKNKYKITFKVISDSIIVTLSLPLKTTPFSKTMLILDSFFYFIKTISHICFDEYIDMLYRGSITLGDHFEKEWPQNNLFTFSPALVHAVELEKKHELPRISISSELIVYLKSIHFASFNDYFYRERNKYFLNTFFNEKMSSVNDIDKILKNRALIHKSNDRILKKLEYLIKVISKIRFTSSVTPSKEPPRKRRTPAFL